MIDMEVIANMYEIVIKLILIILFFSTTSDAIRQEVVTTVLTTNSPLSHQKIHRASIILVTLFIFVKSII